MGDWSLTVKRLEAIYKETSPDALKSKAAARDMDDFTRLKQEIHAKLMEARKITKEIQAIQEANPNSAEAKKAMAIKRHAFSALMKEVGPMHEELRLIQEKDAKRAGKQAAKDPEIDQLHKAREEVVKLVLLHIEEIEEQSKRRPGDSFGGIGSPSRRRLLEGGSSSTSTSPIIHSNGDTELADFNVENELELLRHGEEQLDKNLEDIARGVSNLKTKAERMGETLKEQDDLIDDIQKKTEAVTQRLTTMNEKLKNVEKAMSGDKFIINCVLVCIILMAIAFIATQFT